MSHAQKEFPSLSNCTFVYLDHSLTEDLVHDDLGYGDGMQQVRLARATTHSAMRLFRQEKSAFDELPVFVVFTDFGARLKQFLPLLLD